MSDAHEVPRERGVPTLTTAVFPKRVFTRDVLWNVASLAILGVAGMVINTYIMVRRGPQALGSFNQVFAFYIVASQFAVGGLQLSCLKHCSHAAHDLRECSRIVLAAMTLVTVGGGVLCLTIFSTRHLIGDLLDSPAVAQGLGMMAPGLLFFSLNKVLLMTLNALRHMRAFAVFQSVRYLLLMSCIVAITELGYPSAWLPLALSLTELILLLAQAVYIQMLFPVVAFPFSREIHPWYPRHIGFGARGFLSGAFIEFNTRIDVLMLGWFFADAVVGIYSFAAVFAEGFAQLTVIMKQNLDPIIGRAFADHRLDHILDAARKVRRRFWPIMAVLGLLLIAGYPALVWLFSPGGQTWQSWPVLGILVTGTVLGAGYRPMAGVFVQADRPGVYTLLIATCGCVNILLNLLLIPPAGICGAAMATAIATVLESISVLLLARTLLTLRL